MNIQNIKQAQLLISEVRQSIRWCDVSERRSEEQQTDALSKAFDLLEVEVDAAEGIAEAEQALLAEDQIAAVKENDSARAKVIDRMINAGWVREPTGPWVNPKTGNLLPFEDARYTFLADEQEDDENAHAKAIMELREQEAEKRRQAEIGKTGGISEVLEWRGGEL